MKTRKLTLSANAWLTSHASPDCLRSGGSDAIKGLSFFDAKFKMGKYGYTLVGMAEIVIDVADEQSIIENKVAALREEKAAVLGKAQAEATDIERKIQTLLAITFEGPEA